MEDLVRACERTEELAGWLQNLTTELRRQADQSRARSSPSQDEEMRRYLDDVG